MTASTIRCCANQALPFITIGATVGVVGISSYYLGRNIVDPQLKSTVQKYTGTNVGSNPLSIFNNTGVNATIGKRKYTNRVFSTGDTCFAFGIGPSFFAGFRTSESQNSTSWSAPYWSWCNTIQQPGTTVYNYAKSPNDDEFVSYWDRLTQRPTWIFVRNPTTENTPSYTSLQSWLTNNLEYSDEDALRESVVVFGSGSSCFARTEDKAFWQDLPLGLSSVLEEKKKSYEKDEELKDTPNGWIPNIVALGGAGTFIAIWQDGRFVTSMNMDCPGFESLTNEDCMHEWENIVLSPHNVQDHFAVMKNGPVLFSWIGREDNGGPAKVTSDMFQFLQFRAKADGSKFSIDSVGLGKTLLKIDSESDWTAAAIKKELKLT